MPVWHEEFNAKYQYALGDTIVPRDNSLEIVRKLQGKVRQYVVSNGTIIAQNKKLRLSGLGALMDGIFLSEELGVEKPNIEFFEKTFSSIGQVDPRETIIIGDSLSSDIRGGNNAGILTCWYNPSGKEAPENLRIDYEIGICTRCLICCKKKRIQNSLHSMRKYATINKDYIFTLFTG